MSNLKYDTLNPASFSGETELDVSTQGPGTEANSIKQLLSEFNGLYAQRLRCLELDKSATREELMQVGRSPMVCCYRGEMGHSLLNYYYEAVGSNPHVSMTFKSCNVASLTRLNCCY